MSPDLKRFFLPKNPEPAARYEDLEPPGFKRPDLLMRVIQKVGRGSLTTSQIDQLAQELYTDSVKGINRPLVDVVRSAGLVNKENEKDVVKDTVLYATALHYDREEMEQETPFPQLGGPGVTDAEMMAGSGPGRPLKLELFIQQSVGHARSKLGAEGEIFTQTARSEVHLNGYRQVIEYRDWKGLQPLFVVNARGTTLQPYPASLPQEAH